LPKKTNPAYTKRRVGTVMSKAESLVIMFTDIVGFTELTSTQSR